MGNSGSVTSDSIPPKTQLISPVKPLNSSGLTGDAYDVLKSHREELDEATRSASFSARIRAPIVCVDTTCARTNSAVVKMCLEDLGWHETQRTFATGHKRKIPHIYWSACNISDVYPMQVSLTRETSVNKLPGMIELAHKQNFTILMRRMQALFPDDYDFYPECWLLPQEFKMLMEHYENGKQDPNKGKNWYILKPDAGSQGAGIRIADHPMKLDLDNGKKYVVQQYVKNPVLLEGLKFDLRTYVLIRKLEPLEIMFATEGMARFCTIEYTTPTKENSKKTFMHLTNYSLNKNSPTYQDTESMESGSKRTMTSVLNELESVYGSAFAANKVLKKIEQISVKIVVAMMPDLLINYHYEFASTDPKPQCFHILGLDFLLDEKGNPLLLEINASPSLSLSSATSETTSSPTANPTTTTTTTNHPSPHFPPNATGSIPQAGQEATGIELTQALTEDPSNCEEQIQSSSQSVNSKVDESIKKPIVLESLLLACPQYQIIPTWGHMTTLKQSCAVNYPKGIFKNTEIPSTEPILKLIYCHKDKKTDKLRFFEKVAAIFIQHMTCKRTRTALNAAGVGNRQQIITASLTSQYQSISGLYAPDSTPKMAKYEFRSLISKVGLTHKKYAERSADLDLFYSKHAVRWAKHHHLLFSKENTLMSFNAFLDAWVEIAIDCCLKESNVYLKLNALTNHTRKMLGIDDNFASKVIPKPPSLPLLPLQEEQPNPENEHSSHNDKENQNSQSLKTSTNKRTNIVQISSKVSQKLKRENTTGSMKDDKPKVKGPLTRSSTLLLIDEDEFSDSQAPKLGPREKSALFMSEKPGGYNITRQGSFVGPPGAMTSGRSAERRGNVLPPVLPSQKSFAPAWR
ncbi:uncharacterized protein LOC142344126 [Convolutriloba macropyga]|uniref:uncharacterized protein LOC142344126 n=1 Tax=Convolutriloba macropyga TaxID=536237 RepID=UPI003F52869A